MTICQSDIDALNAAIANPEKQVALNGQQVVYRSIDELIRARDALVRQLAEEQAATLPGRIAYGYQRTRG